MDVERQTSGMVVRGALALGLLVLGALVAFSAFGESAVAKSRAKFRAVPLQRILSVRTDTVDINGNLFRYSWDTDIDGNDSDRLLKFNRTSCNAFQFVGAQLDDNGGYGDSRPEMVVLAEGLPAQTWVIPLNAVGLSPVFRVNPGRAVLMRVRSTVDDGNSDVYVGGFGMCKTRDGKRK